MIVGRLRPACGVGNGRLRLALRGRLWRTLTVLSRSTHAESAVVSARLCRKLDVNCLNPLSPDITSDKDGIVRFDVVPDDPAVGFTGYVIFSKPELMTGLYFFNPAVDRPVHIGAVQMVTPTVANLLTLQVGAAYDQSRGIILFNTLDCTAQSSAGVMLEVDPRDPLLLRFYAIDGLPTASAVATDMDGWGGLINVPVGTTTVTGRLADGGRRIGTVSLFVKPNTISYSRMVPLGT